METFYGSDEMGKRFFLLATCRSREDQPKSASGSKSQTERDGKTDIRKNGMMMGSEKAVGCVVSPV